MKNGRTLSELAAELERQQASKKDFHAESRTKPLEKSQPEITIEWRRDPHIQAGCAGHTIDGRFLRSGESVTPAGRVVTEPAS